MSKNYYVVKRKPTSMTPIHLGKNSKGYLFNFHYFIDKNNSPPIKWDSFKNVKEWLEKYTCGEDSEYVIVDEYDNLINCKDFLNLVQEKQNNEIIKNDSDNFKYSYDIDGYRFSDKIFC